MPKLVEKYAKNVRENEPIEYCGLLFYPLMVEDYSLYSAAKPSFELMQASLPPAFARLSWFGCLDELDKLATEKGEHSHFLELTLLVIARSLRLESAIDKTSSEEVLPIRVARFNSDGKVSAVIVGELQNPVVLSTNHLNEVREIISAQNCYEIPDENWNPELVKAKQYTDSQESSGIVFDLDTLVASVAHAAHVRPKEIWKWTIKEFIDEQDAIDRALNYQIYTQASCSGFVKFKNGNPYPTWKFNKEVDIPDTFTTVTELDKGANGLLGTSGAKF